MGKNLLRILTLLLILAVPTVGFLINVGYAATTLNLTIGNAHDADSRVNYGVRETIAPQVYFTASDNTYTCLRIQLEIDKTAVDNGYVEVKSGGGTFPDLPDAKKTTYYGADKNLYRVEYEFAGLKQSAQLTIPFPFTTAQKTPHNTKVPTTARVVTCDNTRKVLSTATKTYNITKELKISENAALRISPFPEDPANTANVRWYRGDANEHHIIYDATPQEKDRVLSPCTYSLGVTARDWVPTVSDYGSVTDPTLKLVVDIPAGMTLSPTASNAGWTYDAAKSQVYREIKPGAADYYAPSYGLRLNCQGEVFSQKRLFTAHMHLKDSSNAQSAYTSSLLDYGASVEMNILPKGMRIVKDNYVQMQQEKGTATTIYPKRRDIKVVDVKNNVTTTNNYSYFPTSPWSNNPFVYRLTIEAGESIDQYLHYIGDPYGNYYRLLGFKINSASSRTLIDRMKKNGQWVYYLSNQATDKPIPIPTSNEVTLPGDNAATMLYIGKNEAKSEAEVKDYEAKLAAGQKNPPPPISTQLVKGEKLVIDLSFQLTPNGHDNIIRILDSSSQYNHANTAKMGYSSGKTGTVKSTIDTNKLPLNNDSPFFRAYTGNNTSFVSSVCQAGKEYPGGCARYGQYMMAIDLTEDQLPLLNATTDYKAYSVTLFPLGYEYVGDMAKISTSNVADVPVKSKIIANYKGTGKVALIREYDLNALKKYPLSQKVTRVEAPISVRADDYAIPGNTEIVTYWYGNGNTNFKTDLSAAPAYRPATNPPSTTSFKSEVDRLTADNDDLDPLRTNIKMQSSTFTFSAPTSGFLSKLVSGDVGMAEDRKRYGPYSVPRRAGDQVTYKLSIYAGVPLTSYEAIDILPMHKAGDPSVCDYDMVPVNGVYSKRKWQLIGAEGKPGNVNYCSAFSTPFSGDPTKIAANQAFLALFDVKFSTEIFKGTPSATNNFTTMDWKWKDASAITDWGAVSAFYFKLKAGKTLEKATDYVFYTNNTVNSVNADDDSLSVNQAAFTTYPPAKRTIAHWTRTNNAMVNLRSFKITGHVFYDDNKDGHRDATDFPVAGRKVTLVDGNGTEVNTQTDADGNYTFWVSKPGQYTIKVAPKGDYENFSTSTLSSSRGEIYSAVDRRGVKVITLDQEDQRVDAGVYELSTASTVDSAGYKAYIRQNIDWSIQQEVLKNNESGAGKQYVKTDNRTDTVLAGEEPKEVELTYRTNIVGTPRAIGDPRGGYEYLGFVGKTTFKNYTTNPLSLDPNTLPKIQFYTSAQQDLFKCTFGIEPTLFKEKLDAEGNPISPTVAELEAQEEQLQKDYLKNIVVPARSAAGIGGQSAPIPFYCIFKDPKIAHATASNTIKTARVRVVPNWANFYDRYPDYQYAATGPDLVNGIWKEQSYNVYHKFTVDKYKQVNGGYVKERFEDYVLNEAGDEKSTSICSASDFTFGKIGSCSFRFGQYSTNPIRGSIETYIYNTQKPGSKNQKLADWQHWPGVENRVKNIDSTVYLAPTNSYQLSPERLDLRELLQDTASVNLEVNPIKIQMALRKVGEIINKQTGNRKNLDGASFALYRDKTASEKAFDAANPGSALVDQTDPLLKAGKVKVANGIEEWGGGYFAISELYCGMKYYLTETRTPSGYNALPAPVEITLSKSWPDSAHVRPADANTCEISITTNELSENYLFLSPQLSATTETDAAGNKLNRVISSTLQVYNAPIALLPLSGGAGGVYSLAFLGLLSFAFAAYRIRKSWKAI